MNKISNIYKLIIVSFFFYSCSTKSIEYKYNIINGIPKDWNVSFKSSETFKDSWWEMFNDSLLNIYYDDFVKENPDLNSIINQLNISDQSSNIEGSIIYPALSITNSSNYRKNNLSSFGFSDSILGSRDSTSLENSNTNNVVSFESATFGLNLSMQWELDLWGKLLNARKAAHSKNVATIYELKYLEFSLKTQFIKIYYQAVESYKQYKLAKQSNELLLNIRNLVSSRYKKGLRTSIDLRLAESSLSGSKIILENRKIKYKNSIRNLQILIGQYPSGKMIISTDLPKDLPNIPIGLPVDLIERRPDIKSEIQKLETAGYKLAQSKRDRLPSIYLTASGGTSTDELKEILNGDYTIWNFASNITAPIFQGGRIKSNIQINENNLDIAKSRYTKKILSAFSEVETFLFNENSLKIQYQEIIKNEEQTLATYELAIDRYESGLSDLITVFNLQQQWINSKSQKINIEYQKINSRLNLLLALGGDFKKD